MPTLPIAYHHLTHHIVPGPQSISYFIPHILLPLALLTPRIVLSRWQNIIIFMPLIVACTIHAWWRMGGVDVISVNTPLWSLFLLALKDPWKDFRWIIWKTGSQTPSYGRTGKDEKPEKRMTDLPATVALANDAEQVDEQSTLLDGDVTDIAPTLVRNETDKGAAAQSKLSVDEEAYPATLWRRLVWVNELMISIRLNNWKISSSSHDRYQPPTPAFRSRTSFAAYAIFCFVRGYVVLDFTSAYISYDPYFTHTSIAISAPLPPSMPLLAYMPSQLVRSMIIGAQAWALISQMFYLPCLLPVLLHALGWLQDEWSPHNWPTYFGSPSVIFRHGVRGFWGGYWHQTMRYTVSGPGYAIADATGLRKGGLGRYAVISAVAFGLSGCVHMGLVPPEPLHATIPPNAIWLYVAGFFWLQPLAMLLEVLTARIITRTTGSGYWQENTGLTMRMVLSGLWVLAWFSLCIPLLGEAGRQLGYWRHWIAPVSLWKGVKGEGWVAWPILQG